MNGEKTKKKTEREGEVNLGEKPFIVLFGRFYCFVSVFCTEKRACQIARSSREYQLFFFLSFAKKKKANEKYH